MKTTNQPRTLFTLAAAAMALGALTVGSGHAALLVYEGFQYETAGADRSGSDLLHGQPDGSGGDVDADGLGGTWQDSTAVTATSDMFVAAGSLLFGDLAAAGNHVRGDTNLNNDLFSRPITVSLSSGNELWFSVLANKLQNNFSAAEGGLVIGNQAVNNPRILLDDGAGGLQGFGVAPTTDGNNWTPYAWDGSSQSAGDAALTVPTNGSEVHLLVGQISFDTGDGGTDRYTLYDYQLDGGSVVGGTLNAIASTIEIDVDQSALDTLSLTRQVNTAYDEIRIGTSLEDVLGIESPAATTFPLTITPDGGGGYNLTWPSQEGMLYNLRSSTDLSGGISSWTLVEGDIPASGTGTNTQNVTSLETRLFYAVEEYPAPPVVLLYEDFDTSDGGFTSVNNGTGTAWAYGAPTSPDQGGGAVTADNGGSGKCWGTDIGDPGGYLAGTDTVLRSPVIDLTEVAGASLSFAQALDIEPPHSLVVNVIEAATDIVLQGAVHTSTPDPSPLQADWKTVGSIAISGGQPVRIEWHFTGNGSGLYLGAYIDDVTVSVP